MKSLNRKVMRTLKSKTLAWIWVSGALSAPGFGFLLPPSFAWTWTWASVPPLLSSLAIGFATGCYFTLRSEPGSAKTLSTAK